MVIQLRVGEYYLQRNGRGPFKILREDDDPSYSFDANNGQTYTTDGMFYEDDEQTEFDLVEHVPDTDKRHPDYTPENVGDGWRRLNCIELVQKGDECRYRGTRIWNLTHREWSEQNSDFEYRRRVESKAEVAEKYGIAAVDLEPGDPVSGWPEGIGTAEYDAQPPMVNIISEWMHDCAEYDERWELGPASLSDLCTTVDVVAMPN